MSYSNGIQFNSIFEQDTPISGETNCCVLVFHSLLHSSESGIFTDKTTIPELETASFEGNKQMHTGSSANTLTDTKLTNIHGNRINKFFNVLRGAVRRNFCIIYAQFYLMQLAHISSC